MSLSGFSMRALAAELNSRATGARIDRVFMPTKNSVVLALRRPGENLLLYVCTNSANAAAYFIDKNFENPPEPPVFCMVLRKQLETGRIAQISQTGADRMLKVEIDTVAGGGRIVTKTLIMELMGKYSNIILTDEDNRIIDALKKIGTTTSRVRTVLPGDIYEPPPPPDKINPFASPPQAVVERLKALGAESLQKALVAVCLGFGPDTAREVAFAAGVDGQAKVEDLTAADFAAVTDALAGFVAALPEPTLVTDEATGKVLAFAAHPLDYLPKGRRQNFATLSELLFETDRLLKSYVPPDKERLKKLVKNEINRAARKIGVLQKELADAENAEDYRKKADNIMAHKPKLKDHADAKIIVADIYDAAGADIEITMDKRLTVIGNYEWYYKKYNKLKRAQSMVAEQIAECKKELLYLASVDMTLDTGATLADIAEVHDELVAGGYLKERIKRKAGDKHTAPYKFVAPCGMEILVGKNNTQNDRLTFKIAAKHDIWLHAKDIPGSHVILRTGGQAPDEATLLFAAGIAAKFSQAGDSSKVPVDYTECRQVKKPSGAKPGFVNFFKQKTVYVDPTQTDVGC